MSRATQDSTKPLDNFQHGTITLYGLKFQIVTVVVKQVLQRGPTTPERQLMLQFWFGLIPFRSPLLGESLLFSFPPGTKMFQFPGFASRHIRGMSGLQPDGLPHSEIRGSKAICASPRLIAAYHVLHRL